MGYRGGSHSVDQPTNGDPRFGQPLPWKTDRSTEKCDGHIDRRCKSSNRAIGVAALLLAAKIRESLWRDGSRYRTSSRKMRCPFPHAGPRM
jgi:hypothetical protein